MICVTIFRRESTKSRTTEGRAAQPFFVGCFCRSFGLGGFYAAKHTVDAAAGVCGNSDTDSHRDTIANQYVDPNRYAYGYTYPDQNIHTVAHLNRDGDFFPDDRSQSNAAGAQYANCICANCECDTDGVCHAASDCSSRACSDFDVSPCRRTAAGRGLDSQVLDRVSRNV